MAAMTGGGTLSVDFAGITPIEPVLANFFTRKTRARELDFLYDANHKALSDALPCGNTGALVGDQTHKSLSYCMECTQISIMKLSCFVELVKRGAQRTTLYFMECATPMRVVWFGIWYGIEIINHTFLLFFMRGEGNVVR